MIVAMSAEMKGLPGLKAARERAGLSQSALARAVEAPERQVQRWERGEASPSVWAALAVARVLGATVEELAADHSGEAGKA
jgi:DNA-binding XRE family transcriptional regulator